MCLYIIGKHWGSFLSHCIISNDESTPKTKGKNRAISHANVEKKTVDSDSDELDSQIDPRVISTTSLSKMLQILIRFITNQTYIL